jgi:hypothetical protein
VLAPYVCQPAWKPVADLQQHCPAPHSSNSSTHCSVYTPGGQVPEVTAAAVQWHTEGSTPAVQFEMSSSRMRAVTSPSCMQSEKDSHQSPRSHAGHHQWQVQLLPTPSHIRMGSSGSAVSHTLQVDTGSTSAHLPQQVLSPARCEASLTSGSLAQAPQPLMDELQTQCRVAKMLGAKQQQGSLIAHAQVQEKLHLVHDHST